MERNPALCRALRHTKQHHLRAQCLHLHHQDRRAVRRQSQLTADIGPGLDAFEIRAGYMEMIDIEKILKKNGIHREGHLLRRRGHLDRQSRLESLFHHQEADPQLRPVQQAAGQQAAGSGNAGRDVAEDAILLCMAVSGTLRALISITTRCTTLCSKLLTTGKGAYHLLVKGAFFFKSSKTGQVPAIAPSADEPAKLRLPRNAGKQAGQEEGLKYFFDKQCLKYKHLRLWWRSKKRNTGRRSHTR